MTAEDALRAALNGVNWSHHVQEFLADTGLIQRVANANLKLARWSSQLEIACQGNPALSFIRAMQIEGHYVAALIGLALYKPAASSMRACIEDGLYFAYFRTHPIELATLQRDPKYFLDRTDITEYLRRHEPRFSVCEQALGLNGELSSWYKAMSGIIHGQLPGTWVTHRSLKDIAPDPATRSEAVEVFEKCVTLTEWLFLCTLSQDSAIWAEFAYDARHEFLRGLAGPVKAALALDPA